MSLAFANLGPKSTGVNPGRPVGAAGVQKLRGNPRPQPCPLEPLGLPHEPGQPGNVGNSKVTPLTPQEADRSQSTQLPGHGLAVGADAVGNVGQGRGWRQQGLAVTLARMGPGVIAYLPVELRQGSYLLYCLFPEASSGRPHVMLGMLRAIQVK